MKRRTVAELCERYGNEDPHTRQVRDLALRLYDNVARVLIFPKADRCILDAACLLHDIGYPVDPARHHIESAKIVLDEGLKGFNDGQRLLIAGAALLHRGSPDAASLDGLLERVHNHKRLFRIASFLRVADGLDSSHVQDTRIRSIRRIREGFRVTISCDVWEGNAEAAERKANMWNEHLPIPVSFILTPGKRRQIPFEFSVRPGDTVIQAARRILFAQFRMFKRSRRAFLEDSDPEALHDMRVSLNRFRAGLRMFRPCLSDTSAALVRRNLSDFRARLGSARDLEVWNKLLESLQANTMCGGARGWQRYLESQQEAYERQHQVLSRLLKSESYSLLVDETERFLRVDLSELLIRAPGGPFDRFAARKIRRGFERVLKYKRDLRHLSSADMHKLRLRCKRLRFWTEFGASLLSPPVRRLARRLKAVTSSFGNFHDMDVNLHRSSTAGAPRPAILTQYLRTQRKRAFKDSRTAWHELRRKKLRKAVMTALSSHKHKKG